MAVMPETRTPEARAGAAEPILAADPGRATAEPVPIGETPDDPRRYRLIDWVTLGYFTLNTLLLAHPNRPANWPALLLAHMVYLAGAPFAIRFSTRHPVIRFFREWYPLLGILFMYNEIQYLNRILTDRFFDPWVIAWEEALFGRQLATDFRGWIPWKPFGEMMHFGYFSYYLHLPTLLLPLWLLRRRREFRISMGVVAGTYIFCYLWYIFFPVTGPYWQFTPVPSWSDQGWFFPRLTNAVVAGGSSRGSAFPSSHIAASVAVVGMTFRYLKPVFPVLVVTVTLLSLGTVYGGFHYAIDAVCGLTVGLFAAVFGPRLVIWFDERRGKESPG
jgi:membrane-associated phospholipid phosphatase